MFLKLTTKSLNWLENSLNLKLMPQFDLDEQTMKTYHYYEILIFSLLNKITITKQLSVLDVGLHVT